jgi:hypothetical protein
MPAVSDISIEVDIAKALGVALAREIETLRAFSR